MKQNGSRVVIAEDDTDLRTLLATTLRKEGVDVTEAGDGDAAVKALREAAPDLLCLDLSLPVVNGFEVLRLVRRDPALEGLRVIVMSGRTTLEDVATVEELGVVAFVTKPFKVRDLTVKILGLLKQA